VLRKIFIGIWDDSDLNEYLSRSETILREDMNYDSKIKKSHINFL